MKNLIPRVFSSSLFVAVLMVASATVVGQMFAAIKSAEAEVDIPAIEGSRPSSVDYGSTIHTVCDSGCTHTTIKSALNDLSSDGGKVVLKDPKLTLENTIQLRSNVAIEFESGATIKYSGTGKVFSGNNVHDVMFIDPAISLSKSSDAFYFSNSEKIIISHGEMTGIKGSNSAGFECKSCADVSVEGGSYGTFSRPIDIGTASGQRDGSTDNVWVEGTVAKDSSIECIKINDGSNIHVNDNTVSDCSNNGIDTGFNIGVEIKNNKITNAGSGTSFNAVGIHTDSSDTLVIRDNTVDESGTDGISLCGSDNNYVIGNTILHSGQNIQIFNKEGYGIEITSCDGSTADPDNTIIEQNEIKFNEKGGIYVGFHADDVQITDNTIQSNGAEGDNEIAGKTSAIEN